MVFCKAMTDSGSGKDGSSGMTPPLRSSQLRRLKVEFEATAQSVLRMLSSMHRQGQSIHTHLSQLLLRLDYNGYFSGEAADTNPVTSDGGQSSGAAEMYRRHLSPTYSASRGEPEVRAILAHDPIRDEYLVQWEGLPESDNTWEPAESISADLIQNFKSRSGR
eukprot:TRINITY_DN99670_c0_g1_i1.p1 TRINITY_DN99670_c0_g1~~TRINITY_DN99670_c0_g1_i1.p1  ORF type:complete len:182 (+),score=30.07 TRINITY_DN99670_c0_g1_i1:60-548(+)